MTAKTTAAKTPALTSLAALGEAAECLKILAHPHRLRMVQMLRHERYTVGELAKACAIPSHMASEHLRLMQRCGLLGSSKEGRKAYYAHRPTSSGGHHELRRETLWRGGQVIPWSSIAGH